MPNRREMEDITKIWYREQCDRGRIEEPLMEVLIRNISDLPDVALKQYYHSAVREMREWGIYED